jgi:hypothetical protein
MLRGFMAPGRLAVAGLVAGVVGSLPAGTSVSAQAPPRDGTVFVHSARSGKLGGGRLTLLGVGPRVTWTHESGRSGVMAVKSMHRMVFAPTSPEATATLHVAGHRGGDEPTFKLSQPRYNRARHLVSYRAKPLNNKSVPARAVRAAATARAFGPASLTIEGASPPELDVQPNTYPCATVPSTTCWGTLTATGLRPGSPVTGFAPQVREIAGQGLDTGQGVNINLQADAYGTVKAELNLLCNNPFEVISPSVKIDATSVTPSTLVDAPDSCGPPA